MSTAEKFDEGMIDHRSYVHNPNFCLLGVEDTGHVTIEHCLTNLLFFFPRSSVPFFLQGWELGGFRPPTFYDNDIFLF